MGLPLEQPTRWVDGAVPQNVYGAFTFSGAFSGNALADFLFGLPATSTRSHPKVNRPLQQDQGDLFAVDSFRATRGLTIEYGIRWDYVGAPSYEDGYMSSRHRSTGGEPAVSSVDPGRDGTSGPEGQSAQLSPACLDGAPFARQPGAARRIRRVHPGGGIWRRRVPESDESVLADRDVHELDHERQHGDLVHAAISGDADVVAGSEPERDGASVAFG